MRIFTMEDFVNRNVCLGFFCVLFWGATPLFGGEEKSGGKDEPRQALLRKEIEDTGVKIVAAAESGKQWDLYVVNVSGGERRNLTQTLGKDEVGPRVSPNGNYVAYVEATRKRAYEEDQGRVRLLETATGKGVELSGLSALDRAEAVAWSCDSKELAVSWGADERNRQGGVRIFNLAENKVRTIAADKVGISDIDWSGDGKYFVFGARESFGLKWQIMAMNADGSGIRRLAFAPRGGFCHAAWSRDNQIAVNTNTDGLVVFKFDSQGTIDIGKKPSETWHTLLSTNINPHNFNPRWSPDGRYILWSMPPGKKPTRQNVNTRNLYVVRVADGQWTPIGVQDLIVGTVDYDWVPAQAGVGSTGAGETEDAAPARR
jgi:Tol biopolymer transport system component